MQILTEIGDTSSRIKLTRFTFQNNNNIITKYKSNSEIAHPKEEIDKISRRSQSSYAISNKKPIWGC